MAAFPYFCWLDLLSSTSESSSPAFVFESHREGTPLRRHSIFAFKFVRYLFSIALWPLFLDWHNVLLGNSPRSTDLRLLFLRVRTSGSGEGESDAEVCDSVGDAGAEAILIFESAWYGIAMSCKLRSSASVREENPRYDLRRSRCWFCVGYAAAERYVGRP